MDVDYGVFGDWYDDEDYESSVMTLKMFLAAYVELEDLGANPTFPTLTWIAVLQVYKA